MTEHLKAPLSSKIGSFTIVFITQALFVSLAWILLFQLNQFFFANIAVNKQVCWIFLPAFIRILAVMVFEWAGVFGLILGAYITRDLSATDMTTPFVLALISGLAPYLSVRLSQYSFDLPESFDGLKPQHLFIFALAGSIVNTLLNNLYYLFAGMEYSITTTFIPMMVGDFVGTLLMLYFAAIIIRSLRYYSRSLKKIN